MSTPYRRFQHWRAERRRRRKGGCDGLDACGECGCDLFLLSPLLLARVLLGSFGATAVDPYVVRPARPGGRGAARLVRSYQLHVSARRARPVCRMTPTCSRYGLQALSAHGLLRGTWLIGRRLRRCGRADVTLDPVPPAR
ncbi:membrane protein insertion efficiency factor YidD [Nocardioides dongxiaopingii]|uniref:membrane protein insertion efficiency factor YidD n=1 Tax=Nocardioides sp. S-1144 TaxID=2582905 RepID=UPI0021CB7B95|nr:membrane protein insertion efficiency factor YidD [Nocardioides sp. S-1144]